MKILTAILILLSSFKVHAQKGKIIKIIKTDLPISCVNLSPDQKTIAIGDDTEDPSGFEELEEVFKVSILNASDLTVKYNLFGHQESIESLNFSPDSKMLISTDKSGIIKVWQLDDGKEILNINSGSWVQQAQFSITGSEIIAIQGFTKKVMIYNLKGDIISELQVNQQINDFTFDPKTHQIYLGCQNEIQTWSLLTRQMVNKKSITGIMCIILSHDNNTLAIGSTTGEILLYSKDLKEIMKLNGHFKPVICLNFSLDDDKLASSSSDHSAVIWDLGKKSKIVQLINPHNGKVNSIEIINIKNEFITTGENKELKLWK